MTRPDEPQGGQIASDAIPLPAGWGLSPDDSLRRRGEGTILIGGSPFRILRLREAGARNVDAWFGGAPVGSSVQQIKLARMLLKSGMAHPRPNLMQTKNPDQPRLTVVIPVRDDPDGLATTLEGLAGLPVVVVDDGSRVPISISEGHQPATELIRLPKSVGPGEARNTGLTHIGHQSEPKDAVAFVDAGVRVTTQDLERVAQHLLDPTVVATAPRVRSTLAPSVGPESTKDHLVRYERAHSPLDLGPQPASVGPRSTVTYLPSACLVVRLSAARRLGFDRQLRYGEDVDLEWRLNRLGSIRYDPFVVVSHPPRPNYRSFIAQRVGYGSAAAGLAKRHGRTVSPFRSSRWSVAVLTLAAFGRPLGSLFVGLVTAALVNRKLRGSLPDNHIEALLLTSAGHLGAAKSAGQNSSRSWWPLSILGLFVPGLRAPLLRIVGFGFVSKLWRQRKATGQIGPAQIALSYLDDFSYGVGVWKGMLAERSLQAICPDLRPARPLDDAT